MSKFTPGPWRAIRAACRVVRDNQGPADQTGSVLICVVGDMRDREIAKYNKNRWSADTHLISAAPAMLAALKRARKSFEKWEMPEKGSALADMDAAIAKAEGEGK